VDSPSGGVVPLRRVQTVAMAVRIRGVRDEDLTVLLWVWRAASTRVGS
jgi:hypothetical protein